MPNLSDWNISGGQPNTRPAFSVKHSVNFALPDNTNTILTFDTVQHNSGAFDVGTGIFTAPVAGLYHFSGTFRLDVSANTGLGSEPWITIVSSTGKEVRFSFTAPLSSPFMYSTISAVLQLNAGETVTFRGQQTSGASRNLNSSLSYYGGYYINPTY